MWYLVLSKRVSGMTAVREKTAAHFIWMKKRHAKGEVIISGPTPDRKMGIYVIRADSVEAAVTIADSDPFHQSGLREYQILEWEVHQMLGIGPFSLAGIEFIAQDEDDSSYTKLPED